MNINKKTDFTFTALCNFLNEKYGSKIVGGEKNGKKFNHQDIQQYVMRGKLPDKYGGYTITVKKDTFLNITLLSIPGLNNG